MLSYMKMTNLSKCLVLLAVGAAALGLARTPSVGAAITPTDLRCEYGRNPTAVGEAQPRLSWVVAGGQGERGVVQSAYQVLVASSPEALKSDQGEWWDSGKTASSQSVHVLYGGKELGSAQTCFWKVRL